MRASGPGVFARALLKHNPQKIITVEEYIANLNVLRVSFVILFIFFLIDFFSIYACLLVPSPR